MSGRASKQHDNVLVAHGVAFNSISEREPYNPKHYLNTTKNLPFYMMSLYMPPDRMNHADQQDQALGAVRLPPNGLLRSLESVGFRV